MTEKPIGSPKTPEPAPSTRRTLPTTKWGRPSSVPPGTGFGFGFSGERDGITRYLIPGREAMKAENVIALFEKLKGRAATDEERAEVERELAP